MPIQTDREIKANRPDIVIKDKQEKSCLLVDMSIPTEKNTSVKVAEKLSKYKDLEIEIERKWGMKATTFPVVIGALGLIKKGLEKYTKQIPGNIKILFSKKVTKLLESSTNENKMADICEASAGERFFVSYRFIDKIGQVLKKELYLVLPTENLRNDFCACVKTN